MQVITHIRKGNIITTLAQPEELGKDGKPVFTEVKESSQGFKSINEAKRHSRKLQSAKPLFRERPVVLRTRK